MDATQAISRFHDQPLHISEMGRRWGEADCPVTEAVADRIVRVPLFSHLSAAD